jgi:hypothetical protein
VDEMNLKEAVAYSKAATDIVAAAYWHNGQPVVMRLMRRDPDGFRLIFDDGGEFDGKVDLQTPADLLRILKPGPGDDPSTYAAARDRVIKAAYQKYYLEPGSGSKIDNERS